MLRFPLPTIAAVNGPALAGGFDLAVLCDLRIASTTARFAHPERTFGDVVYGPLHDLVGGAVARELTIGGRELDAPTRRSQLHLVGEVVPAEALTRRDRRRGRAIVAAPRDVLDAHQGQGAAPRRLRRRHRHPRALTTRNRSSDWRGVRPRDAPADLALTIRLGQARLLDRG